MNVHTIESMKEHVKKSARVIDSSQKTRIFVGIQNVATQVPM